MKYDTLKAIVNAKVYENTEQRITGGDMNNVLQSAIASLGAHYQMGGLVSPTDQITVGDEPVVFLATTPGTYTHFGGIVVADGEVALLVWSGTAWSKQTPDIATRTEVSQLGQYVDNPEWERVVTDNDGRILYGVKTDGKFYFGDGCPPPVQDYVQQQISEYGVSVDAILATKVDKVTGKSLIDADFASSQATIENPEWLQVTTDSEGRILGGRKQDGTVVENCDVEYPHGIPNGIKSYVEALTEDDPRYYGAKFDGVTDDSAAINACIIANGHVRFRGNNTALVAHPIMVKSNTWLDLDNGFTIKLADESNCALIQNQWAEQAYFMERNLIDGNLPSFMSTIYPDYGPTYPSPNYVLGAADTNIKITGGVLDGNGANQSPQQYRYGCIGYWGILMKLVNINGLEISDVTLYDPCTYFTDFSILSDFYFSNITFKLKSLRLNQDGLHFDGECYNGVITGVFGQTNDDMVTFNGGDSWYPKPGKNGESVTEEANRLWYPFRRGKISNITVRNIHATSGYRATRLLSNNAEGYDETEGIDNIFYDGIFGDFRADVAFISKHHGELKRYTNICFNNISAISTGEKYIWIDSDVDVNNLVICHCSYNTSNASKHFLENNGTIKNLSLNHIFITGVTGCENVSVLKNSGNLDKLKIIDMPNYGVQYGSIISPNIPTISKEIIMSDFN